MSFGTNSILYSKGRVNIIFRIREAFEVENYDRDDE